MGTKDNKKLNAKPKQRDTRRRYVAMKMNLWKNVEALTPFPMPVCGDGKSVGFLLVYDDLEALELDNPGAPHITVLPK